MPKATRTRWESVPGGTIRTADTHRQSPPEGSMTVDPAASARDAAAEVLRQYIEECDRLRAEVLRLESIAYAIALEIDSISPEDAERSLRSIARHETDAEHVSRYVRAADIVRDAHADRTARIRAELDELRTAQSAGRSP